MNLPAHPSVLYKWTCPDCEVTLRTRTYDMTIREARHHSYHEHRRAMVGIAVACLWDDRIKGMRVLCTYEG